MPRLTPAVVVVLLGLARAALAGPPFVTDDPEPVDYRHWELYLATEQDHDAGGWSGTLPHLEVNYGAAPELQLHAIVPLAYVRPDHGPSAYGLGDLELGAKYRFLDETARRPQLGVFPLVLLPTGAASRGLGDGHVQAFLPLWLQKSWGDWLSYGGGGYWIHPGAGNRNWLLVGWEIQRKLGSALALGVELFHSSADAAGGSGATRFNLGAMVDLGEHHHLLVSGGLGLQGDHGFQGYFAYQLTFGPGS